MSKIKIIYDGNLHCRTIDAGAGKQVVTDASPGKEENFSPTELVALALGSCMLMMIGAAAQKSGIDTAGSSVEVEKEMVIRPVYRIGKIQVNIIMPPGIDRAQRKFLEEAAGRCPVHKSLHPDIQIAVNFRYPD
ncbi:MAG: OsmC family protein [Candidatus Omnitrophota bacterium]